MGVTSFLNGPSSTERERSQGAKQPCAPPCLGQVRVKFVAACLESPQPGGTADSTLPESATWVIDSEGTERLQV